MKNKVTILLAALLLAACKADNQYSSRYICNFSFDTSLHSTTLLTRSLTNPGWYVIVNAEKGAKDITHLKCTLNDGKSSEDIAMSMSAIESNYTSYDQMGANHRLVIGCNTFPDMDGNKVLKAYDGHCPNCLDEFGGNSYPLTFDDAKTGLVCAKCKRIYLLTAEGMPINKQKDDQSLLQYHARLNGAILQVTN